MSEKIKKPDRVSQASSFAHLIDKQWVLQFLHKNKAKVKAKSEAEAG